MDSTITDGVAVAPFLTKTYDMVDDPSSNSVVSWSEGNNSFIVWNVPEFQKELLPKYFKHSNFSSFIRQLNTYGFRKVDPDHYEFANEGFLRGQKHLLRTISRKKHGNQPPQVQSSSIAACVEVGKFGLEEEVERLKRDKNVLMQELVRLRQQQQTTDLQVQTVGQRVQVMELRQQQMMSFLAKAMQSPGFLGQLVQQQNESSQSISGGSKKRRLPKQNEENAVGWNGNNPSNGQIINFHSSMNEAAKAMLHQILKLNSSSKLEPMMNNSTPLLLGNLSSNALDNGSSTSRISEVMTPKVLPNSGSQTFPAERSFSGIQPSAAISESTPCMVTDRVALNNFTGMSVQNPLNEFLPDFSNMSETVPETASGIPMAPSGCDIGNSNCTNLTPPLVNLPIPGENDAFPSDQNMGILVDGIPRLPSINDAFWEQFLSVSPSSLDTDEINSTTGESCVTEEPELQSFHENGWDKIQRLNDLTQQMELLASASRIS